MRITFNFPVVVDGTPGRAREKRKVLCYVPVEHEVPVLTEHDAPVALSYIESDKNGFKTKEEFRGYEGSLFHAIPGEPAAEVNYVLRKRRLEEDSLFVETDKRVKEVLDWTLGIGKSYAKILLGPAGFAEFLGTSGGDTEYRPMSLVDLQVKDYNEKLLSETVATFQRKIAKLVIIGDRFYLPEPEPVFKMVEDFGDIFCNVVRSKTLEFGIPKGNGRELPSLGFFRMDQEEEMLDEAKTLATAGRIRRSIEEIMVYDPSLLTADTEAMSMCEVAAGFTQRFLTQLLPDSEGEYEETVSRLSKALAEVPLAQFALYQRLVNGVAAFKRDGDLSEVEAAVMAVLESDKRALERFYFLCQGDAARFAEAIGRRWNDREVSLERDFQLSATPAPRG
jgi:hypothetical protein